MRCRLLVKHRTDKAFPDRRSGITEASPHEPMHPFSSAFASDGGSPPKTSVSRRGRATSPRTNLHDSAFLDHLGHRSPSRIG